MFGNGSGEYSFGWNPEPNLQYSSFERYGNLKASWNYGGSGPASSSFVRVRNAYGSRTTRPTSHRQRPAALWSSPTPLSVATTSVWTAGAQYVEYAYGPSHPWGTQGSGQQVIVGISWNGDTWSMPFVPGRPSPKGPGPSSVLFDLRNSVKEIKVNVGPDIFEWEATCGMFLAGCRGLRRVVGRAPRLVGRPASTTFGSAAKTAADTWLAGYFGILPSLNTLYSSLLALSDHSEGRVYRLKAKGSTSSSDSWEGSGFFQDWQWTREEKAVVYVTVAPSFSKFTVGNPAEIAWELTRLSFMVDWFYQVGNFLSSLDAMAGVESVIGTLTERNRVKVRLEPVSTSIGSYRVWGEPSVASMLTHSRKVISELPVTFPPSPSISTGLKKLATGLAILVQLRAG